MEAPVLRRWTCDVLLGWGVVGEVVVVAGDPGKNKHVPETEVLEPWVVSIPRSRQQGTGVVKEAEVGAKSKAISVARGWACGGWMADSTTIEHSSSGCK